MRTAIFIMRCALWTYSAYSLWRAIVYALAFTSSLPKETKAEYIDRRFWMAMLALLGIVALGFFK